MVIDVEHKYPGLIEKFGENMPRLANLISSAVGEEFAEYVRNQKLSGQALGVRTGRTKQSTKFLKNLRKEGEMFVRPGIGVQGMLNYLMGFEKGFAGGRLAGIRRPFMRPAAAEFKAQGQHRKIADRIISAMIRRGGFR